MEARIQNALISVFDKTGLEAIIHQLSKLGVKIYSTGGTADFIQSIGAEVHQVETLTGYPSILDGRVKSIYIPLKKPWPPPQMKQQSSKKLTSEGSH